MEFRHPEKWRDTCDVFALEYHEFRPVEVLGYPHAGNDVFHVRGVHRGRPVTAYVKAARRNGSPAREADILEKLDFPCLPRVLDSGDRPVPFIVTQELPGRRLSVIVEDTALEYMEEYGETLARLHRLEPDVGPATERRFMRPPEPQALEQLGLSELSEYFSHPPSGGARVFCHGDFHYANVLWDDHHISGILDFELAGWGDRDYDIAWALILRPGQTFMKTEEELRRFLDGYSRFGQYDPSAVRFYMAQIYTYFLPSSEDEPSYADYVRRWLTEKCVIGV